MEEVAKQRDIKSADLQDDDFRITVYEKMDHPEIEGTGYYFDAEGKKPLYELIIVYKDEALRDAAAAKLLGSPNYENNTEWLLPGKNGYQIKAWKYKNKLIITALIPNTEWYEDVHGK